MQMINIYRAFMWVAWLTKSYYTTLMFVICQIKNSILSLAIARQFFISNPRSCSP